MKRFSIQTKVMYTPADMIEGISQMKFSQQVIGSPPLPWILLDGWPVDHEDIEVTE